ncbi:TIGR04255 family protein [Fimbriimonadia bacterium ATM]|nr:MAG: TIGR04255 family protein [Armatimonadota bacterium]MBC6969956.1 TIGR04255 family protein [Armatimonadota bacterium]MCE7900270.1 TIGR04255 family protein [Armatimonadetes bacterium ATM1]MDL1928425.1 TIGR04255 family protein [Fimbriimonadia bacterium ATM]RIJ96643.1 MAG: hypothetical protein DCC45_06345 [Armatimonadota bacterium]
MRLDFSNLPLIEAAIRFTFAESLALGFETMFKLAERVRPDYAASDLPARELPPGQNVVNLMPVGSGMLFQKDAIRVTLQSDMLASRWIRSRIPGGQDYVRYPTLKVTAEEFFKHLAAVCGARPSVSVVNMVYVNFIRPEEGDISIHDYFEANVFPRRISAAARVYNVQESWQEPDSVDLTLDLQEATIKQGEQELQGYRFATAGGFRPRPGEEMAAIDLVHDRLQVFFNELLTARAKSWWALQVNE